ncbi:hypothetical protein LR48_Vigan263s000500 [Vigna angularis]|uniref:Uncharacterized protein n=1 Tax=Phaseolus angularis TaxID=3914 RepID=A0A0L9T722_PHAAN|nr:hypothetical protein LR48_Vigan263s000500 [Vigna angularis]
MDHTLLPLSGKIPLSAIGHNCFSPKIKEEDRDKEEKLVHQDFVLETNERKPSKPVKLKNRLWVTKAIKANGVLEIEAPYSRRVKLYAASLGIQCISLDEFITRMSWPGDQAQASEGGARPEARLWQRMMRMIWRKSQMPLMGVMIASPDAARSGFSYVFVSFMHA